MTEFPLRLVAWEMSRGCNLACVHCRAGAGPSPDADDLTFDEGRSLIAAIARVGKPILILTGGEPLLRPDLFDLARFGVKSGLRVVLATNGVLVTPDVATRIAQVGIARVSISLDGPTAAEHDCFRMVPGAFESALTGIAQLRKVGVSVQINTTITRRNRAHLADMVKLAEKVGADSFHVFLLVPTGRARKMAGEEMAVEEYEETLVEFYRLSRVTRLETKATCAPQYYRIMRQQARLEGLEVTPETFGLNARTRGCLAGLSFVFVSHRGELQPCGYLDIQAGNVRKQEFAELWETAPLFRQLRNFRLLEGTCHACDYIRFCGGCRARAYEMTGNVMNGEPYCGYVPPAGARDQQTA